MDKEQKRLEEQKKEEAHAKEMIDFFGEPICIYSHEQAVEDGILADVGVFDGRKIVFTCNLLATLAKQDLLYSLLCGLSMVENDETDEYLFKVKVGEKVVWVHRDSQTITFMFPEDY